MILRWMFALFKWVVTVGLIAGVCAVTYRVYEGRRADRAREGDEEKVQSPRRTKDGVVDLGVEDAARYGLEEGAARAVSWTERVTVYGEVVPNPSATVEVRSPFAGTVRADPGDEWPSIGQPVRSGQTLGWVDIRVGPQERLSLEDSLNNARLKEQGDRKVVELQRERVARVEKMSRSLIVPGQQLDDAKVLLAEAETQLAIASAAVELWRKALDEVDRPGGRETSAFRRPLTAPADGEVSELAVRPGMAIEAGGLVAQLVDFRHPLVRLDIPPALLAAGAPGPLRLLAITAGAPGLDGVSGEPESPGPAPTMNAIPVGPAPRVDAASQFVGYWYGPEADRPGGATGWSSSACDEGPGMIWRPGLLVKASMTPPEARARQAVEVPGGAVLFHQGRPLVYVRVRPGADECREVRLLGRDADSWVVAARQGSEPAGLEPGEVIVRRGTQVLLSEEFRGDVDVD